MRRLEAFEPRFQKKILRRAVKGEITDTVLPAVLSHVPYGDSGRLAQAVRVVQAKRSRKRSSIWFSVSLSKDGFYSGRAFYGAFQNFGWRAGARKSWKASMRRQIPGKHFMEKAYASCEAKASEGLERRLREGVDEITRELNTS